MPTYTVSNQKTGEEKNVFCSYDELEKYLQENTDWSRVFTAPSIVTHTGNIINKTSGDWKDLMKKIDKNAGSQSKVKT